MALGLTQPLTEMAYTGIATVLHGKLMAVT